MDANNVTADSGKPTVDSGGLSGGGSRIQRIIDRGRGKAANKLGGLFSVYRIGTGGVNFIDPANQVYASWPVYWTQKTPSGFRGSFEGTNIGLPMWDIIADMSAFNVGDVFISQTQPYPVDFGRAAEWTPFATVEFQGFCLAYHGAVKKAIGGRLDRLAQVYRMNDDPDAGGYFAADISAMRPIVLVNGLFSVGAIGGTPAFVPVGMASRARWRSNLLKAVPTTTGELEYLAYVPTLPGFRFRETDMLVLQDGSRYVVELPWEQEAGFAGSQLSMSRRNPQN